MRVLKICCWPGHGLAVLLAAFLSSGGSPAYTQTPQNRVPAGIGSGAMFALRGSVDPHVSPQYDVGRMGAATPMNGITMYFQPTAEQKAQLDALVQEQQTPGSPLYHQWLTPAEYANLFGLSSSDVAQVANWLRAQGFTVQRVGNSRTSITFSGTAGQVETAFGTEMHRYMIDGVQHFANSTNVSVPSALAGVVQSIRNLNDFRPSPQVRFHNSGPLTANPDFTTGNNAAHFLTPDDVATIYDVNAAYNSGENGSGETIAVLGQSQIAASDIEAFQKAAGLSVKDPTMTLVPNTGTSETFAGDEAESDLDVEYSGGIARGATIDFVYVGNNQNVGVYDAMQYAIDNGIGTILSLSYGTCEPDLSGTDYTTLDAIVEQGASQGQSLIDAAGDDGSTGCFSDVTTNVVTPAEEVLAVMYPASSAFATGVGGTEFPAADIAGGNTTYWQPSSGSDLVSSALSYIPEGVWNDDSAAVGAKYGAQFALSAGAGGVSALTARPTWQTGVTGIPSGDFRLVPDISLDASPNNAGYLYCTSDTSAWNSGQKASCDSGFRDSATQDLTVAGGTSFAAPIFAGLVSIINQKTSSSGQGVVAAKLYPLAANAATYATAFHDITTGTNACTAGSNYCSSAGASEYAAGVGYDEASGLGSVDFNNLLSAWTGGTGTGGGGGTFKLAATNVTVTAGASGTSTVTVTPANSYAGTVGFTVTSSSASLSADGCYAISNATVTAGTAATTTLTIYTSSSACTGTGVHSFARFGGTSRASSERGRPLGGTIPLSGAALAGVMLFGFRRLRAGARRMALAALGCLMLAAILGLTTGCGSSSGSTTTTDVAKGTYTVTVTGTDTTTASITASTTLTLTVQ